MPWRAGESEPLPPRAGGRAGARRTRSALGVVLQDLGRATRRSRAGPRYWRRTGSRARQQQPRGALPPDAPPARGDRASARALASAPPRRDSGCQPRPRSARGRADHRGRDACPRHPRARTRQRRGPPDAGLHARLQGGVDGDRRVPRSAPPRARVTTGDLERAVREPHPANGRRAAVSALHRELAAKIVPAAAARTSAGRTNAIPAQAESRLPVARPAHASGGVLLRADPRAPRSRPLRAVCTRPPTRPTR